MNHDILKEAAGRVGQSFYYYDLDAFRAHVKSIKETCDPGIKIWYACKANPMSEILRILSANGIGADVASLGELTQARHSGIKDLIATGPAKTRAYLGSLLEAGVRCIVIESINQLKDLNDLCGKLGRTQDVLLRLQLDHHSEDKSVLGGSSITPFGLGADDWKTIDIQDYKNIRVLGLHSFQWGNILDVTQLQGYWVKSLTECRKLALEMKFDLRVVDLGGGLGLSYVDDQEINFSDVHAVLKDLKQQFEIPEIWMELGRFLMGKFGTYLTRVVDIKTVRGKDLIVTEGGINHMARSALVGQPFPCEALSSESTLKSYSVHGPLCTALDHLGEHQLPANLKLGDWLAFNKCGAYGFTESMPYFLCHNLAGEVIMFNSELQIVRAPKTHLEWMV